MKKIKPKYLPIGTVVMLKNGRKRVMITSFCITTKKTEDGISKYCDYGGCLYPEGCLNGVPEYLFNHSQIDKVYHMGLEEDEEEKEFKNKLTEAIKDLEKNNKMELAEVKPLEQEEDELEGISDTEENNDE